MWDHFLNRVDPYRFVDGVVKAFQNGLPSPFGRVVIPADEPEIKSLFPRLTENQQALYDKAGELYLEVHHNPAYSKNESYCVEQLTAWLADKHLPQDELDTMEAVFSERWKRNNEGSGRTSCLGSTLCSEGHKYRWILTAIAES